MSLYGDEVFRAFLPPADGWQRVWQQDGEEPHQADEKSLEIEAHPEPSLWRGQ